MYLHAVATTKIDNDDDVTILVDKINKTYGDNVVKIVVDRFDTPPDAIDAQYNDQFATIELILSTDGDNDDDDVRAWIEQTFDMVETFMILN